MKFVIAFLLALVGATASIAQPLSPDANEFVNQGAKTALSQCDLPKRSCKSERLVVKSADVGEFNSERQSVETLAAKGMNALIVFSTANRNNYQLGTVEVTNARWPDYKGIRVGTSRSTVVQTLGSPNNGTSNSCDSYVDEEHGGEAMICYKAESVSRIRWEYPIN
jgi:hypothetical protein